MCDITKCKKEPMLGYAAFDSEKNKDVRICTYHWEKHCDEEDKFDLREYFYPSKRRKSK